MSLGNVDVEIDKLAAALGNIEENYQTVATRLSRARQKAATQLEQQVTAQLVKLGMRGAVFKVSLAPIAAGTLAATGLEEVEFLISTNPGQAPRALNKIVSGGELSRISLAIQVVTADTSKVPSLVFDEVDVGIGGAVAEVVGNLLRRLGAKAITTSRRGRTGAIEFGAPADAAGTPVEAAAHMLCRRAVVAAAHHPPQVTAVRAAR